jgi:hypothetical protein
MKDTTLSSLTSSSSTLKTLTNLQKDNSSVTSRNTSKRLEFMSTVQQDLSGIMSSQKLTDHNGISRAKSSFREQILKDMETLTNYTNKMENRLKNTAKRTRKIVLQESTQDASLLKSPSTKQKDDVHVKITENDDEEYFSCEEDECDLGV